MDKTKCDFCDGEIVKVKVAFTNRWTCNKCNRDYGYGDEPIMDSEDYLDTDTDREKFEFEFEQEILKQEYDALKDSD